MKPIKKFSVTEQVAEHLKEYIQSEHFHAGDKLPPQGELGKMLGVGRSAIREAICLLEASGTVEVLYSKGIYVVNANAEREHKNNDLRIRMIDLVNVRYAIEPLAVKLAIERSNECDFEKLGWALSNFKNSVESKSAVKIEESDHDFHNMIIQMSKNEFIATIMKNINLLEIEMRRELFKSEKQAQLALVSHNRLCDAILIRDIPTAMAEMFEHINSSLDEYFTMISLFIK